MRGGLEGVCVCVCVLDRPAHSHVFPLTSPTAGLNHKA